MLGTVLLLLLLVLVRRPWLRWAWALGRQPLGYHVCVELVGK